MPSTGSVRETLGAGHCHAMVLMVPSRSRLGPSTTPVHNPARAPAPPASVRAARQALSRPWHLAVLTGSDAGLVLPVPARGALGRADVLTDPAVSRRHLSLTSTAKAVTVADVGSANGTMCAGGSGGGAWAGVGCTAGRARSCVWGTRSWSCGAGPAI